MDPIPAWVRKLWDTWDVRMLVLLSLTLQIILFIFGNRRKYIQSLWINVVVWLAYLMADWVATVALGQLSDAQVDSNNALRAIWAPLLLFHLGGPDTITAYSLEDNRLWMRHFMGLVVQLVVAVYVILISWRNSWFFYLSFPALMAGIIKYGERTWVLKSLSSDKNQDTVPFHDQHNLLGYNATVLEDRFLRALILGHMLLKDFKLYMQAFDISSGIHYRYNFAILQKFQWDDTYCWDALEVEMGLMFDIYYTKTVKTYTKRGCILRSISFACTMSVLVGLFWLIFMKEKWSLEQDYYSMLVDITITGLLLVGALALEIYALTLLLSSDWTMLWLIKQKRDKLVIQLGQKIPWLFPMHRKKRWSKRMGQFDLFGFCVKTDVNTSMLSRTLGLLGIQDKFNRYTHKTFLDVPPYLHSMISHYIRYLSNPNITSASVSEERFKFVEDDFMRRMLFDDQPFEHQLFYLYAITEIFYANDVLDSNTTTSQNITNISEGGVDREIIRETCKTISRYMIYLYITCPSLLPIVVLDNDSMFKGILDGILDGIQDAMRDEAPTFQNNINITETNVMFSIAEYLNEKQEVERWRILKTKWLWMICHVAYKAQKNFHLQQLTQGGELLTLLWCFISQSPKFEGFDVGRIYAKLVNQPS